MFRYLSICLIALCLMGNLSASGATNKYHTYRMVVELTNFDGIVPKLNFNKSEKKNYNLLKFLKNKDELNEADCRNIIAIISKTRCSNLVTMGFATLAKHNIYSKEIIKACRPFATCTNTDIKLSLVYYLKTINKNDTLSLLIKLLYDKDPLVSTVAIESVCNFSDLRILIAMPTFAKIMLPASGDITGIFLNQLLFYEQMFTNLDLSIHPIFIMPRQYFINKYMNDLSLFIKKGAKIK